MTYKLCLKLIALGRMSADKLDVYYAANRLTTEEYEELIALIPIEE